MFGGGGGHLGWDGLGTGCLGFSLGTGLGIGTGGVMGGVGDRDGMSVKGDYILQQCLSSSYHRIQVHLDTLN